MLTIIQLTNINIIVDKSDLHLAQVTFFFINRYENTLTLERDNIILYSCKHIAVANKLINTQQINYISYIILKKDINFIFSIYFD